MPERWTSVNKTEVSLVEQIGEWVLARRPNHRWAILLCATCVAALFDFATYQHRVSMAALYLAPIIIACWTLAPRQAAWFTIAVAIIAGLRCPIFNPNPDFWEGVSNNVGRLISFGVNAAVVIGLKRSYDRLAFYARHDPMTGVLNRLAFEEALKSLVAPTGTRRKPILLAYIDLDGFKTVNDRYGHAAGDFVLGSFSSEAKTLLEEGELIGRLGGDEFAIAIHVASHQAAMSASQAMHASLSAALESLPYPVGCSMGALFIGTDDDRSAEELIAAGDNLMYAAKNDGKGRVQLSMALHQARAALGKVIRS